MTQQPSGERIAGLEEAIGRALDTARLASRIVDEQRAQIAELREGLDTIARDCCLHHSGEWARNVALATLARAGGSAEGVAFSDERESSREELND